MRILQDKTFKIVLFSLPNIATLHAHRQQKKTMTMRNPFARYTKEDFKFMLERMALRDTNGVDASKTRAQAII